MGAGEDEAYFFTFLAASLSGLFLFYGFEACGDVAEEVSDPTRRIPRAMILTILVGGVSGLLSYAGYVLAAPDLEAIVAGEDVDPIPGILESTLGTFGSKVFLVVTVTAFISCVLSLQAAGSRLLYSFGRDRMLPGSRWLAHLPERHAGAGQRPGRGERRPDADLPVRLLAADTLARVTAFAVCGIYISFQAVVLAALRQRLKGWRPRGCGTLGSWGFLVNVVALAYGSSRSTCSPVPGTPARSSTGGSSPSGCSSSPGPGCSTWSSRARTGIPTAFPRRRARWPATSGDQTAEQIRQQNGVLTGRSPPSRPRRSDEVQLRDAARLPARGVAAGDPARRRTRLLRLLRGRRDLAQGPVAAVRRGRRDRAGPHGPSVSGVVLREPTLIAQAAATLDELTNGRAEVVLSSGNFGLLAEYKIDWKDTKPLSRVIEGVKVVRTLLDDGAITFDGEFFRYDGLFTFARPVQEHLPVKMGAMRGPKSFEARGALRRCHHALSYTREAYDYAAEHLKAGAEKAGKDWTTLDFGAWVVVAVGRDSAPAKAAARSMVGIYASSCRPSSWSATGSIPTASSRSSTRSAAVTSRAASSSPRPRSRRSSPSPARPTR